MEADAEAYSEVNKPQIEAGSKFVSELGLAQSDKVLDMGCGTGDVTKYIAEIVSLAVGVDPDEARIKIAKEKFKNISNLQFYYGSSVTGFPHDNEPYYDVHVSTSAFHWISHDEKKIYIQKAYQCLKTGGRLAILGGLKDKSADSDDETVHAKYEYHPLTQEGYLKLFQEIGLFKNTEVKIVIYVAKFTSLDEFKRWAKASTHHDFDKVTAEIAKEKMAQYLKIADDGSLDVKLPYAAITASK